MAWWDDEPWSDEDAGEDPYLQHAADTQVWETAEAELAESEAVA